MAEKSALKIGCLNIGALAKNKSEAEEILQKIQNHDMFVILESWLDKYVNLATIKGYLHFRSGHKSDKKPMSIAFGCIMVYYTNVITAGKTKMLLS